MQNEKLKRLFHKQLARAGQEGGDKHLGVESDKPDNSGQSPVHSFQVGHMVDHPKHGTGEVKAVLPGNKYLSVHYHNSPVDSGGGYKPTKVSELKESEMEQRNTKLGKFMQKVEMKKSGEHEKGVHQPVAGGTGHFRGKSDAGLYAREAKHAIRGTGGYKEEHKQLGTDLQSAAKEKHQKVLSEIKAIPKPNLPKSEAMNKGFKENFKHGVASVKHGLGTAAMKVGHVMDNHVWPGIDSDMNRNGATARRKKNQANEVKVHAAKKPIKSVTTMKSEDDMMMGEHLGFNKLKNKIAHEKNPPRNPAAVAAKVGFEKYGKKGMEAKAHAGKMAKGGHPQEAVIKAHHGLKKAKMKLQHEHDKAKLAAQEPFKTQMGQLDKASGAAPFGAKIPGGAGSIPSAPHMKTPTNPQIPSGMKPKGAATIPKVKGVI